MSMTQGDWKGTVRLDAATKAGVMEPSRPASAADNVQPLNWEEFFRHISPAQQGELLSLAGRQGILYAHQLPPSSNGKASGLDLIHSWNRLNQLLAGNTRDLVSVREETLTSIDAELDGVQRQAV